ncbi:MAG TPA: diguanylate cyclase [Gaiellales bacterium]|nr:diguanylate cyclase [Gaiellales bacterium]
MVSSHTALTRLAARGRSIAMAGGLLVGLSLFAVWAEISTASSTADASQVSRLVVAYQQAGFALSGLEGAIAAYRLSPSPANRQAVLAADDTLRARAAQINQDGLTPSDHQVAAQLLAGARRIEPAVRDLLAEVGQGDASAAEATNATRIQPQLEHMRAVDIAQGTGTRRSMFAGLSAVRRSQSVVLVATGVMFMLGTMLLIALTTVGGYRRRLDRVRQAELERLRGAALTDSLTQLPNLRAFHDRLDRLSAGGDPICLIMLDLDDLKVTNDRFGHQAGDQLLGALADRLAAACADRPADAFRVGGDEFAVIVERSSAADGFYLCQSLRRPGEERGTPVVLATAGVAESTPGWRKDDVIRRADRALIEAKRSHRGTLVYSPDMQSEATPVEALDRHNAATLATALARAVDAKDAYTHSHCETVAELCAMIAGQLGLPPRRVAQVRLAGLLHDVGKIGVPDGILHKPGPLTEHEFAVMQTHTTLGGHIVSAAELYEEAGWILHHHERMDGRGYPDGLGSAEIPLESRIIMVADTFEAITADRPYRDRRSISEALAELHRHAGSQFDPRCVAALKAVITSGEIDAGPYRAKPARLLRAA